MNYIVAHPNGIEIHHNIRETKVLNTSVKHYLNTLLVKELTNYEGRLDALRKIMNQQRNIPLFIRENCLIYHTHHIREVRNYCINYLNVLSAKNQKGNKTKLIFKDLSKLIIDCSYNKILLKHKQCERMLTKLKQTGIIENVF